MSDNANVKLRKIRVRLRLQAFNLVSAAASLGNDLNITDGKCGLQRRDLLNA